MCSHFERNENIKILQVRLIRNKNCTCRVRLIAKDTGVPEIVFSKRDGWENLRSMYGCANVRNRYSGGRAIGSNHAQPKSRSSDIFHTDVTRVYQPTVAFDIRLDGINRRARQELGPRMSGTSPVLQLELICAQELQG